MYENVKVIRETNAPLCIRFVGETVCDEKYLIERERSDIISLEYIVDGEGTLEINGQILHPKKGDIFLLSENSKHRYYCDKKNPWHKYFISFNGSMADSLIKNYLPENTYLFENCHIAKNFEAVFDITFNNDYAEKINSLASVELFKIFNFLYDRHVDENEDLADKIKKLIENNINEEFNLDKLCSEVNYSKNHIINIFSKKFSITPYQYYKDSKTALAKDYLLNSKMTIGEISTALSYNDQQYFSYSFKKATGYSPKQYRKIMIV